MTNKKWTIAFILMTVLSVVLLTLLCFKSCTPQPEPEVKIVTDTVFLHSTDTFYVSKENVRYEKIEVLDTIFLRDTILLREQKCYTDSFSTIYVSGVEPEIDSIFHFIPRDTVVINTTETVTYTKTKHWGQSVVVGVQLGYGVTINQTPTFSPYIGLGITYGFGYNF